MTSTLPASELWRGRVLVLLAAVLWSTSGLFAKAPWFDAWPEQSRGILLAFFRSLFALLILVPLIRRPEWRPAMIPMTICFVVMVWSFMSAMVYGPAANAIWLQYLSPAWVLLGAITILKDRVHRADFCMFAFCVAGVSLILVMELRGDGTFFATAMALLSGISFAGVVLSIRSMSHVDPAWLITLNHAATVLFLLPWAWANYHPIHASAYVALGVFGVVQMSIPYLLFTHGLRHISSPEASMLILVEPILVPVWVYIAWHHHPSYQSPSWWIFAGGGLILLGMVQRYLPTVIRGLGKRPWRK